MKIGIFGGTFDPPHIGHLILAAEAIEQLALDYIAWVLTSVPPHKNQRNITSIDHRLSMLKLAISGNSSFRLSRIDIDRDPPHFAIDTMKLIRAQTGEGEFNYLMGLDSLNDLPRWHRPADFVSQCDSIAVMMRHGELLDTSQLEKEIPGLNKRIRVLKTPMIEISASDIRCRVQNDMQYRYYVPEKVYKYIEENRLYK